ncbi:MAG: CDP-diacylglycerol--serine O-phosphatidyltransferase [Pirellulales bacterium]|nr:CDP-diacylglycerol--serine O-phosphatidyltransferase [Pirellulales bacterium]
MRPIRTISVFPTLLTLGNLACGFFAIVVASRVDKPIKPIPADILLDSTNVMISGWLIFLAMIFDGLDGYVARLSNTASDFGAQLDSLSDVVTFGVAPGFLLVKMCPQATYLHNHAMWVIAAVYAACAALRLARFNVETGDEDEHLQFSGLPSPAAAAAIAGFAIMFFTLRNADAPLKDFRGVIDTVLQSILPYFGIFVALLMVSRIPYPHVANQIFRGQKTFAHVVAVVFALMTIMLIRGYSIPIIFSAFVFYGPTRFAWQKWMNRKEKEEPMF